MKAFSTFLVTVCAVMMTNQSALASSPTPTPHPDHKHGHTEGADAQASVAALNAELKEPLGRPNNPQPIRPLVDMDRGGLDDMGSVGGDFEE